ncbi:MAG TPA: HepT-like ribonuclease domain-containing protein [Phycisphaerae bacterium]|nr:HepT-like ribonuclease domain-containing protein [Phycisphaerae bacterium]
MRVSHGRSSPATICFNLPRSASQIIGEAASKISVEYRQAHPEIQWSEIVGLRHRLVHDYTRVDTTKVWEIVQNHIAPLIAVLEPLVPPPPPAATS